MTNISDVTIKIDLSDIYNNSNMRGKPLLFKTKEEWDAHEHSTKEYERRLLEDKQQCPLERAASQPARFPCIALPGNFSYKSNGPDQQHYIFLYKFEVLPKLFWNF